ncbi:competence protein ComJ [Deinococcus sp.]|uniref:competence protein ComJ n=1 Tax=Deinococcus sp. TaxID=47478 RepID=UPI002869A4B2|nr:competence protein ComJ [Deinococcus sp.]
MASDAAFTVVIGYRQIAVFDLTLDAPFNHWTDLHIRQGFTWRPGSVSFRTVTHGGEVAVRVRVADHWSPLANALAQIKVPFTVPLHGQVAVASIADERVLHVMPGEHQLICEAVGGDILLTLVPQHTPTFHIHRVGPQATSGEVLITTADPA